MDWNAVAKRASVRIGEAHGPPRGSALNALPSFCTSAAAACRPLSRTKATWSVKRARDLMRYFAPPTGHHSTMLCVASG